jgi:hypothetical protein
MLLMLGFLFMCLKWAGEFDPTNNIISGERHIVTAYIDYPIFPTKGIILVQET